MPNYVVNHITLVGATKERMLQFVERYFSTDKYDETYLDFNKVIKMPTELANTTEGSTTPNEVFKRNYAKYGYRSWYDWAIVNWGTKWNSFNVTNNIGFELRNGSCLNECYFETAWNPSKPVIKKIAEQNPDLIIEFEFADEDSGYQTGRQRYENGKLVEDIVYDNCSKEAFELYFELWGGEDDFEWDEENHTYKYREE